MAEKIVNPETKEIIIKCSSDLELNSYSNFYDAFGDLTITEIVNNFNIVRYSLFERYYLSDKSFKETIKVMKQNILKLQSQWDTFTPLKPRIIDIEDFNAGFKFTIIKNIKKKIKDKLDNLEISRKGTDFACVVYIYKKENNKVGILFSNYNYSNSKLLDYLSKELVERLIFENLRPEKYKLIELVDRLNKVIGIKFDPGYLVPKKIKDKLQEQDKIRLISNSIKLEKQEIRLLDLKSFEEFNILISDIKNKKRDIEQLEGYLDLIRIKIESLDKGTKTVITVWSNKLNVESKGEFVYLMGFLKQLFLKQKSNHKKEIIQKTIKSSLIAH